MKKTVITFTDAGKALGNRLISEVPEFNGAVQHDVHDKKDRLSLHKIVKDNFLSDRAIVFIGSCGIAVRLIAPHIKDKLRDPAVIVMDEQGRHVIPILSGHIGGANELSLKIAQGTGAVPVITTATDLRGDFAADLYAKKNGMEIEDREDIVKISSRVLSGSKVTIQKPLFGDEVYITADDARIRLRTRPVILGIGCKKGTRYSLIEIYIKHILRHYNININDVGVVATIDLKKDEKGLVEWCDRHRKKLLVFTAEELMAQEGDFTPSDFVKKTTGADNVCERAVVAAGGRLQVRKLAKYGITLAIGRKDEG